MDFLKKIDFNKATGYLSIVFVSIAISFLIFSIVYMLEGQGWLVGYEEEAIDLYLDIGWNWIRGSGIAFVAALILLSLGFFMLRSNKNPQQPSSPLFGKLDLNQNKGMLGVISLSVSFVFFLNGILYRIEMTKWFWGAIETGRGWKFEEASAWATSAYTMFIIGILLSALGWLLIILQWKKGTSLLTTLESSNS